MTTEADVLDALVVAGEGMSLLACAYLLKLAENDQARGLSIDERIARVAQHRNDWQSTQNPGEDHPPS